MRTDYPTPLIMWTWQDAQVEDAATLRAALDDIAEHGFAGVLAMLRGSRYALSDPLVIAAAREAAIAAHARGLAFWFALDPRLDQGRLIALPGGAARYLLTGRDAAGKLPCASAVDHAGRFRLRLEYGQPRGQHMLSQVAMTFEPEAVECAVAYRRRPDGMVDAASLRDVTAAARLFVQRALGYLEIFGRIDHLNGEGWSVLALPRCRSTYPEVGAAAVQDALLDLYRTYHAAGVALDGVFWDEIGYVTGYGSDQSRLPYGRAIRAAFAARHGASLRGRLPLLLLDDGQRAARVRHDYYAAVQDVVLAAQARCFDAAAQLWGADLERGIHQTWHQDADDLPHGSGDWWRGSAILSGGYTDVGDAERWDEPAPADETLAMVVTATSLARAHERPLPFVNLWGVDYGAPTSRVPATIVDWWAHLLTAYGIVWLTHTYGPNGYIDRVTNWGPGYPDHPTWDRFTEVNARIARVQAVLGGRLPVANVAVVWPLGTLARIGGAPANAAARDVYGLIAGLARRGAALDILSPALFAGGVVRDRALWIRTPRGEQRYDAVIYPHPDTLLPAEVERIEALMAGSVLLMIVGMPPWETTDGRRITAAWAAKLPRERERWRLAGAPRRSHSGSLTYVSGGDGQLTEVGQRDLLGLPQLVVAPPGAIANLFALPNGERAVTVVPAQLGGSITGAVWHRDLRFTVTGLTGMAAVRFGNDGAIGDAVVVDGAVREGGAT